MNVLALGSRTLQHPIDVLKQKIKMALQSLAPNQVISDYDVGWNLLVAEVAQEMGISVIGAVPFSEKLSVWPPVYVERRTTAERHARTNTIFAATLEEFQHSKQKTYIDWLDNFSNSVLTYYPPQSSSFSHSLMIRLKASKPVFNLYGGF